MAASGPGIPGPPAIASAGAISITCIASLTWTFTDEVTMRTGRASA